MSDSPRSSGASAKLLSWVSGYFDHSTVDPAALPAIMWKHIYTGIMGSLYGQLIGGLFFSYFWLAIGLTPAQQQVWVGISSFLVVAQLFSALAAQRTGRRKFLWWITAISSRGLRLVGVMVALWLWYLGCAYTGVLLIAAMCVSDLLGTMSGPPWFSWLADIIPDGQHGAFWGRRSFWISLSIVAVTVPSGLLIDQISPDHKLNVVVIIFIAATVVGLLDIIIHGTIPEPAGKVGKPEHFMDELLTPIRDRGFRPWLIFYMCWCFAMYFGGVASNLFVLDDLHLRDHMFLGIIAVTAVPLIGGIFTSEWSGRLVDKLGPKRVLRWAHVFWSLWPAFWIFATPATAFVWVALGSLVGGTANIAGDTAANKLVTRFPPKSRRAVYVAVSGCLASMAGGLGSFAAAWLQHVIGPQHINLLGCTFGAFHAQFALSVVLRLACVYFFLDAIRDPAKPTSEP